MTSDLACSFGLFLPVLQASSEREKKDKVRKKEKAEAEGAGGGDAAAKPKPNPDGTEPELDGTLSRKASTKYTLALNRPLFSRTLALIRSLFRARALPLRCHKSALAQFLASCVHNMFYPRADSDASCAPSHIAWRLNLCFLTSGSSHSDGC